MVTSEREYREMMQAPWRNRVRLASYLGSAVALYYCVFLMPFDNNGEDHVFSSVRSSILRQAAPSIARSIELRCARSHTGSSMAPTHNTSTTRTSARI